MKKGKESEVKKLYRLEELEERIGLPMEHRVILLKDLRLDDYQRGEVKASTIEWMVDNFNLNLCLPLVVGQRASGTLWVVDGKQRTIAAHKCLIRELQCMVFQSKGKVHEAKVLYDLATRTTPHTQYDKYKAAHQGHEEPQRSIQQWLSGTQMQVCAGGARGIAFVQTVIVQWQQDAGACQRALLTQDLLQDGLPLSRTLHMGLYWLERQGVRTEDHATKLIRKGADRVRGIVNDAWDKGKGRKPIMTVVGETLRDIINQGRRANKILV